MLTSAVPVDPDHPWLGLSSFTNETRDYFFGRTAEVREIRQRVIEHPLTILYGQAGYGKTSLLGAGLIPKLKEDGYNSTVIRFDFGESGQPLIEHARFALNLLWSWHRKPEDPERVRGLPTLWELLHRKEHIAAFERIKPVLVFDQFEEIFTLTGESRGDLHSKGARVLKDEAHDFFTQLADVIENRPPAALEERFRADRALARKYDLAPSPLRIVLTLREDYLSHLEAWKKSMPSLMRNRMALKLLSGPQALDVVVKPGRLEGRNLVSDDVGAQIVRFVAKRPAETPLSEIEAVPPLLSLLCDELNTARLSHTPQPLPRITAELVTQQSADILQNFYARCFEGYPPALRHFVEDRLLTSGGHRIPVAREDAEIELAGHGISPQAIDALIHGRLLTQEERGGLQRLEIVHDKLAELALASQKQRHEREAKEKAERESRDAHEREELSAAKEREAKAIASRMRRLNRIAVASAAVAAVLAIAAVVLLVEVRQHASQQRALAFDAVLRNAEADDDLGESEKVIRALEPFLSEAQLADHPSRQKAEGLVKHAREGVERFLAFAAKLRAREPVAALDLGRGLTLKMVLISPGKFVMGSPDDEAGRDPDDEQLHTVAITQPFYMGVTQVTQEQYAAVTGANPSVYQNRPRCPVESVNWLEASAFCRKLSTQSGPAKICFALPTEAQWEFACRAGTQSRFYFGDNESELTDYAWYIKNAGIGTAEPETHDVGMKKPNAFGLHDMYGNVWQWCRDWYDSGYYLRSTANDPTGPEEGKLDPRTHTPTRVLRGGSWQNVLKECRSANRGRNTPGYRGYSIGFRVIVPGECLPAK